MSQLKYWVWLSMRFGVRPKVKLALVEHFGTPRDVYFAAISVGMVALILFYSNQISLVPWRRKSQGMADNDTNDQAK